MLFVGLIVGGVTGSLLLYIMLYQYHLNVIIERYCVAEKEGKRPLIIFGTLWFTFYENWDVPRLPLFVKFYDYINHKGNLVITHRFDYKQTDIRD